MGKDGKQTMKKGMAFLLLLLVLLPMAALADGSGVDWNEIAKLINKGTSGVVYFTDLDDTNIILNVVSVDVDATTSTYTISTHSDYLDKGPAPIENVKIDARDGDANVFYAKKDDKDHVDMGSVPSAAGTYIFENVVIHGGLSVFVYEWYDENQTEPIAKKDQHSDTLRESSVSSYGLQLKETVVMNGDIAINAGAAASQYRPEGGKTIFHYFNGGSVDAQVLCPVNSVTLDAQSGGVIDALIEGQTTRLRATAYDGSEVSLRNLAKDGEQNAQSGSVTVSVGNACTGSLTNERDAAILRLECVEDSKLTADNDGDIGMLNIHSVVNSHVKFTNDGVILNEYGYDGNGWGDQAMELGIDETSELIMVGKGTIMPGYQWFDYYYNEDRMYFGTPKPGASVIIDLSESSFELNSYAENVEMARKVARRIHLDWDQIEKGRKDFTWPGSDGSEASPHSVLAVYRDERSFIYPVTKTNEYHPALESEHQLDELPADYDVTGEERADAPKVLLNGKVEEDKDVYLSVDVQSRRTGVVRYELEMIDAWGGEYDPDETVELFLPYPGIPDAAQREYEVHHTLKDGSIEYYSTLDGTLRRLENGKGMMAEVDSFSPFEIRWDEDGSLPDTGDHSRLALWIALACAACAALAVRRRRAA